MRRACMQAAASKGATVSWHLALQCAGAAAGSMASVPSITAASAALSATGAGTVRVGAVLRRTAAPLAATVAITTAVAVLASL